MVTSVAWDGDLAIPSEQFWDRHEVLLGYFTRIPQLVNHREISLAALLTGLLAAYVLQRAPFIQDSLLQF